MDKDKIQINRIQKEISELFKKYKIPAVTHNLPMENLHQWAYRVADHFKLDREEIRQSVTELFWSISHVQLALGYALIAKESCAYPKGTCGEAFREEDIPNMIGMPEMHFWHHTYCCYECLYRVWERISIVLKGVCFPASSEKKYFNQIIDDLCRSPKYNQNKFLKELKKQESHWCKIAEIRNDLSHSKSSPFRNTNIEGVLSSIISPYGLPLPKLNYSSKNLKQEIEQIVDKYRKILPAIKAMKDFIDNV
jgi:hypothetical protein